MPQSPDSERARARAVRSARMPARYVFLVNLLAALVVVALVQTLLVRVHRVTSGSMEQTLGVRERVLSSDLPYLVAAPATGDIIIFSHGDTWADETLSPSDNPVVNVLRVVGDITSLGPSSRQYTVKRIVGEPGDTVACCDAEGRVLVNDEALDEPYVYEDPPFEQGSLDCTTSPKSWRCFGPVVVPEESYLVLGDHRSNSADSVTQCRGTDLEGCAQFVPADRITGKVIAKAWPPGPVG